MEDPNARPVTSSLRDAKFSRSCPSDPRYNRLDPKMKAEVKKRERTEKEQRKIDGRYCVLERALTKNEEEERRKSEEFKHEDFGEARTYELVGSKEDLHQETTETESQAEPLVSGLRGVSISMQNESSLSDVKDSDFDSEPAEEEFWDDTDPDDTDEEKIDKRPLSPKVKEIKLLDQFVVGCKGAIFGSSLKISDGKGFPIPVPASPNHFQISYEKVSGFRCTALDPDREVLVSKRRHVIREGDVVEFSRGIRIVFTEVKREQLGPEGESTTVLTALLASADLPSSSRVKIPKGGVTVGFDVGCGVKLSSRGERGVLATLKPLEVNGRKDLGLISDQPFHVKLIGKDSKAPRGSHECLLASGCVISIPGDSRLRFAVTVCLQPREDPQKSKGEWCTVKSAACIEEPNLTVESIKEHQDRAIIKDCLGGGNNHGLFAVFDGHGGRDVADVAAASFPDILGQELNKIQRQEQWIAAVNAVIRDRKRLNHTRSVTSMPKFLSESINLKTLSTVKKLSDLRSVFSEDKHKRHARSPRQSESSNSIEGACSLTSRGEGDILLEPVDFFEASDVHDGPLLAMKRASERVARLMRGLISEMGSYQGSTGQICLLKRDHKSGGVSKLYSASVGDSGAILIRDRSAVEVSTICRHKPDHKDEQARIEKAGGRVSDGRIMNMLAVSRAYGDLLMEEWGVISEPHFSETVLGPKDSHLVIATDGVWDYISSKKVVDLVLNARDAVDACHNILNFVTSGSKVSQDNIAIIVVELQQDTNPAKKEIGGTIPSDLFTLKEKSSRNSKGRVRIRNKRMAKSASVSAGFDITRAEL